MDARVGDNVRGAGAVSRRAGVFGRYPCRAAWSDGRVASRLVVGVCVADLVDRTAELGRGATWVRTLYG